MTIKKIIEDLNKTIKVYEPKKEDKSKPKTELDSSKFTENQKKLENELLRHKSEKEKGSEKALEAIVANGQITTDTSFEVIEKQHFEKQFEKIKAEYKTHEVINHPASENSNDAYNSGHQHKEEHMHHYQSNNQKSVYRNNDSGY